MFNINRSLDEIVLRCESMKRKEIAIITFLLVACTSQTNPPSTITANRIDTSKLSNERYLDDIRESGTSMLKNADSDTHLWKDFNLHKEVRLRYDDTTLIDAAKLMCRSIGSNEDKQRFDPDAYDKHPYVTEQVTQFLKSKVVKRGVPEELANQIDEVMVLQVKNKGDLYYCIDKISH